MRRTLSVIVPAGLVVLTGCMSEPPEAPVIVEPAPISAEERAAVLR